MVYQWKQDRFSVSAQTAGEELERIEKLKGTLNTKDIVEESRPDEAVLNKCFEWDDLVAAEKYRQTQAQKIIHNLVIVKVKESDIEPTRAFVSVKPVEELTENKNTYINISKAIETPFYQNQLLVQAFKDLLAFKTKYKQLQELSKVFEAIDKLDIAI